jgi:predicted nucleic acid-binding protein
MNSIYISDTNIWIDFRHAGLLEVLFTLPFTLCCTDFVLNELNDFDHDDLIARGLQVIELDEASILGLTELKTEHNNSSLADVSCYHLAKQSGFPLLTGDGQLRKQAVKDGLQVHGVLWLLDKVVELGLISPQRAHTSLTTMLAANARLPKAECAARFAAWGTGN